MKETLGVLYRYHAWRVAQLTATLAQVPASLWEAPIQGSFTSLRALIEHCVWAEAIWYARVTGTSAVTKAEQQAHTALSLLETWREQTRKWLVAIENDDTDGQRIVQYTDTKGTAFSNPLWELLLHINDHTTYHTGQIIAALRALGQPIASTNMIFYYRSTQYTPSAS